MARGPIGKACNKWSRSMHRWGAILASVPLMIVIASGLLLQWKKELAWVQPPERRGTEAAPSIGLGAILQAAKSEPRAGVRSWADIDRLDFRPARGVVKVLCASRWELQLDAASGAVLSSAYRRSDLIESIHDGSFFHSAAKHWVFFPAGVGLWVTGLYLWALPLVARRNGRRRRGAHRGAVTSGSTSTSTSPE